jgi:long-chain acyl-CoA synthetase
LTDKVYYLGIGDFFGGKITSKLAKLMHVIPIDLSSQLVVSLQASAAILREGKVMCIFPEGARSIDGTIQEFKKGIGILAEELNIRLVPVYIHGTYESWPRYKSFPRPRRIIVTFGNPCEIKTLKEIGFEVGAKDGYSAIAAGIREKVKELA